MSKEDKIILISKLRKSDLDAYADIIGKELGLTHKKAKKSLSKIGLRNMLKAEIDGKPVGFINFSINNGLYLNDIDVAQRYRNRGVGSMLLATVEKRARELGEKRIWLHVNIKNKKAIQFYFKNNYKIKERIKDYYKKGIDAFVLEKLLR